MFQPSANRGGSPPGGRRIKTRHGCLKINHPSRAGHGRLDLPRTVRRQGPLAGRGRISVNGILTARHMTVRKSPDRICHDFFPQSFRVPIMAGRGTGQWSPWPLTSRPGLLYQGDFKMTAAVLTPSKVSLEAVLSRLLRANDQDIPAIVAE